MCRDISKFHLHLRYACKRCNILELLDFLRVVISKGPPGWLAGKKLLIYYYSRIFL